MAELREAKAVEGERKGGKEKLHHLRIHPHKGGHVVTHHGHNPEPYGPEHNEKPFATHVFGKEQGEELLRHVMKHGKIEMPTEAAENEPHETGKEGGEATEEAQEGEA